MPGFTQGTHAAGVGALDQSIGLVNAKRGHDAARPGASGDASADPGGRPSVDARAGSEFRPVIAKSSPKSAS